VHRVGALAIGDVAVAVAVGAGHRGEAFEACRWIIEEVKRTVPIWKREQYADGSVAWVDPTAPGGTVPADAGGEVRR
jgi:molybdopterin synthase catalytic subunit